MIDRRALSLYFPGAMAPRIRANQPQDMPQRIVVPEPPANDNVPAGLEDSAEDERDRELDDLGDLFALADESYRDAVWYVWRKRDPGQAVDRRSNPNAPIYVTKLVGAIDLDELAKKIGGGSFRLCGYRGGRKFIERPLEIDGPAKTHPTDPPPAPAQPASEVNPAIATMLSVLQSIEQKLSAPPPPPPPPPGQALTFKDVVEAAKLLRPEPTAPGVNSDVKALVDVLKQGIDLGSQRESREGTDWGAVVEKSLPVLEKVLTNAVTRRGLPSRMAPPGSPVPPARPMSHAEVMEQAPPATDTEPGAAVSVTMASVVDALARAIEAMGTENEIEPADFAATAETILKPGELAMLRMGSTDQLMAELASVSSAYPVLVQPQARVFVDAVLSELKRPPEAGE